MLTDAKVRAARPRAAAYRLPDGGGLHLFVTAAGARVWRMRCHLGGRELTITFGAYPAVTLAEARDRCLAVRADIAAGRDPRRARADDTFEAVARAWHGRQSGMWKPHHAADVLATLDREAFPAIGRLRLAEIDAPAVLDLLRRIEARGAVETAHRLRQRISAVFTYAIAAGLARSDPAAAIKRAMVPLPKGGHRAAVASLAAARDLLAAVERQPAHPVLRLAHRLLALTAVRPGELRGMAWTELDGATWRVPAARMKMGREHVVPLARQAVAAIEAARRYSGAGGLVLPSTSSVRRPLSENAIGDLLARAGYRGRHTAHGWRATFSTVMNERHPADRLVIDLMLAHAPRDAVEAAYNRALHADRRRVLAQEWADLLLDGMPEAEALLDLPRRR